MRVIQYLEHPLETEARRCCSPRPLSGLPSAMGLRLLQCCRQRPVSCFHPGDSAKDRAPLKPAIQQLAELNQFATTMLHATVRVAGVADDLRCLSDCC